MNKRIVGAQYEEVACDYLKSIGMKIIQKNYRTRIGEIDIVAHDGLTIVFVEVKYRKKSNAGCSLEAIGYRKRMQIIRVARNYLYMNHIPDNVGVRFDCIGIDDGQITYLKNAFDAAGSVS
ncbi:MAG: YraN family protein [Lachnospiraceae bacterium]|nr:YraN family protein [Lachnospiraceae bacterium]